MSNLSRWSQLSLALLMVSVFATACFRDTSEVIQEQPIARAYPSPTVEQVEEPTPVTPTDAPELAATQPVADQFALTATALIARQTQPSGELETAPDGATTGGVEGAQQATTAPIIRETIPPGEDCVHEIRAGETLFQLSLAYGVTVDAIAIASEIDNPDHIGVGQQVTIPKCGTTGFIPPPTSIPTATLEAIAIQPTSVPDEVEIASSEDTRNALIEQAQEALLVNAQIDPLEAFSAQLSGNAPPSGTYTVQQNDTLFEIAASYGTTIEALAALNDIDDVDNLYAGQVLDIP